MTLCNLLRVPFIFIVDELFKTSFGVPEFIEVTFSMNNTFVNSSFSQNEFSRSTQYYMVILLSFVKIIVSCLIFCSSLFLFLLPARYLYLAYLRIFSVCVVLLSYWVNTQSLNVLSGSYENFIKDLIFKVIAWDFNGIINLSMEQLVVDFVFKIFRNIILQCFLSLVYNFLQVFTTNRPVYRVFSFIIPTLITLVPGTPRISNTIAVLANLLPFFFMCKTFWFDIFFLTKLIHDGYYYSRRIINNYGIHILAKMEWNRLNISNVLQIFWAIRVLIEILYLLTDSEITNFTIYGVVKYLLIKGCDTFTAILGMTSLVSYFAYYIGAFFQWVLSTNDVNNNRIIMNSAVLFYLLSIETGLTFLEPEKRFVRLYQNVCLLSAIPWQYIYYNRNPILICLIEPHNHSLNRHLRALLVCGFQIVFSITLLTYLWTYHSISTWLLEVSSFNIGIIIQSLVSLAVYSLLLIDAFFQTSWENLEDYVYYIKLYGNMVALGFSSFVLLNSIIFMMFLHNNEGCSFLLLLLYISLKKYVRYEWREFINRRTVVRKIESLSEATSNQLAQLDDVCSICYQKMGSAKITRCNHYFHGICLRKLLYVQDRCPLCNAILYEM